MKKYRTSFQVASFIFLPFLFLSACNTQADPIQEEETPITETLLLKDYHPVSIYNVPVTIIEKAAFPIIDMHTHVYANSRSEVSDWVKTMDVVGIEKTIILTQKYGSEFDSIVE
jgi:hypothetical protein